MDRVVELSSSLCLRVRQRAELGLGGSVWDAALTLSHLLTTPQLQALLPQPPTSSSSSASTGGGWLGQVVCELGSGTGVCGLTAAALGAERVVLTDVELYLPLLQLNIDRNRALLSCPSTTRLSAAAYHWGTPTLALRQRATGHDWGLGGDAGRDGQPVDVALPLPPRFPFSVLLVSDCVYDEAAFEPLQSALRRLVGPDTLLLMSYEKRKERERSFWRGLHRRFTWKRLPQEDWLGEELACDDIGVFAVSRRRSHTSHTDAGGGEEEGEEEEEGELDSRGCVDVDVDVGEVGHLGDFFCSYPHDARYRTKEEEEEEERRLQ